MAGLSILLGLAALFAEKRANKVAAAVRRFDTNEPIQKTKEFKFSRAQELTKAAESRQNAAIRTNNAALMRQAEGLSAMRAAADDELADVSAAADAARAALDLLNDEISAGQAVLQVRRLALDDSAAGLSAAMGALGDPGSPDLAEALTSTTEMMLHTIIALSAAVSDVPQNAGDDLAVSAKLLQMWGQRLEDIRNEFSVALAAWRPTDTSDEAQDVADAAVLVLAQITAMLASIADFVNTADAGHAAFVAVEDAEAQAEGAGLVVRDLAGPSGSTQLALRIATDLAVYQRHQALGARNQLSMINAKQALTLKVVQGG